MRPLAIQLLGLFLSAAVLLAIIGERLAYAILGGWDAERVIPVVVEGEL